GREYAPQGAAFDEAAERWLSFRSDPGCRYDDVVEIRAEDVPPTVTWGVNPGQAVAIDEPVPRPEDVPESERAAVAEALAHMQLAGGKPTARPPNAFASFGSRATARASAFVEVARYLAGRRVHPRAKAIAAPASERVKAVCERLGIDRV